jgi:hypothetical protein
LAGSPLMGHFALMGLPDWAAAVATRSRARNPAEMIRLILIPSNDT